MCQKVVHEPDSFRLLLLFSASLIILIAPGSTNGQADSQTGTSLTRAGSPVLEVATIKPVKDPDPNRTRDTTEGRRLSARNYSLV